MADPLDPSALISKLPTLLPDDSKTLTTPHDALAALLHSIMVSVGFRIVGLDDSSPSNESPENILPEGWNKSGPESYAFRYKHEQSSLVFFLKIVKLGNRTVIHGIALESDKTQTLDILTTDYLSPSAFPYASDASSSLVHCFISSSRVKDFVSLYKLNVLQKLVPGLRKAGYEESSANAPAAEARPGPAVPRQPGNIPAPNPYAESPSRAPDYDPLRIPNVGRSDLDPFPRNPFSPPSLFPGGGDGDGMFVGPNHPIFRDRLGPSAGGVGGERRGPWGGDGFLPPMGAPPGARFDPIGPGPLGGMPGRGGFGGPARGGPFGGPQRGNYRGAEPDNDEFMPPGADDMYS